MSAIAGVLVTAAVTPVVALSGAAATSAVSLFENMPANLNPGELAQPTTLYAKQGDELVKFAEFYAQDREPVGWNAISPFVKDAVVAVEDPRFYTHGGVDVLAASRAVVQNLFGGGEMSGASTITMQYVRNVKVQAAEAIPDEEESKAAYADAMRQDMDRKLAEMRLAIAIEKRNTKDDILLGYLNIALFGGKVYGIESAARTYYGVSANDLTLAQAASLAAIPNQPGALRLDIPENIPANQVRRDLILERMLDQGRITQAQYDEAVATPVEPVITPRLQGCAIAEQTYGLGNFCDYVQRQLTKDPAFGEDPETRDFNLKRGGYKIITTIDLDMQAAGYEAVRANVPAVMSGIDVGAAAVSAEVGTGRILAMVQNRPFSTDEALKSEGYTSINYSTDFEDGGSSGFQVGSTFKPITLAEWIRTGHSVRDMVNTSGRTVNLNTFKANCVAGGVYGNGPFKFQNDNLGISGSQSVLTTIAQSLNGGVVSMQQKLDLCNTIEMAEKMGIHRASLQTNPDMPTFETNKLSLVVTNAYGGIDEISPLTMATAYGAFAGGGKVCTPVAIDSITDPDGKELDFLKSKCTDAMSPEVAAGVAYALQYTVNNGLARHAISRYGVPHIAKTGTTDDYMDNWTIGGSSKVITATWVGNAGPNPDCLGQPNCQRVDTRIFGGYNGLTAADTRFWPPIMAVADQKYGGSGFGEPAPTALKQTLVTMPDVTGMTYDDAKKALEAAEFTVKDGDDVDSSVPAGRIARTDPEGGSEQPLGSDVTLHRSLGNMKAIPSDLVGKTGNAAKSSLNGLGFMSVNLSCAPGGSQPMNPNVHKVQSVDPGGGEDAKLTSTVKLILDCNP